MSKITRLRILFPHAFDTQGFLSFSCDTVGYPTGAVLWRNMWPGGRESFSEGCFVQVGMLQPVGQDILGRVVNIPARGIVQGLIYDHVPASWEEGSSSGGWEWLRFSLDFDMNDSGPQMWEGDWHKIRQTNEGFEPWAYSWETTDG